MSIIFCSVPISSLYPWTSISLDFFGHFLGAVVSAEVPEFCLFLTQPVQPALLMKKTAH